MAQLNGIFKYANFQIERLRAASGFGFLRQDDARACEKYLFATLQEWEGVRETQREIEVFQAEEARIDLGFLASSNRPGGDRETPRPGIGTRTGDRRAVTG
jgi:hypothetical protein